MKMVPLLITAGAILTVAGGCSSTAYTTVQDDDDVYYSRADAPLPSVTDSRTYPAPSGNESTAPEESRSGEEYYDENYRPQEQAEGQAQPATASDTRTDGSGNTYVTNNYYGNRYDADDYYDYAYSARIRRFHSSCGFSYYDPWYTNMYWYTYDPYHWGVSIYYGYRWWRPYPSVWFSYGHHSPWYWTSGWHYGYYPGSYWSGYNHGYWHGYRDGHHDGYYGYGSNYNPNYYNSRDLTTRHYGPRKTIGTNGRGATPKSLGEKYESFMALDRQPAPVIRPGTPVNRNNPGTSGLTGNEGNPGRDRPATSLPEETGGRPPVRNDAGGSPAPEKPGVSGDHPGRPTGTLARPERPGTGNPPPDARPAAEPRPQNTYTPRPSGGDNRPTYTQPRPQPTPPRESTPRPTPRSDNYRPGGNAGSVPSYSGGGRGNVSGGSSYSRPSGTAGGGSRSGSGSSGRSSSPPAPARPSPR